MTTNLIEAAERARNALEQIRDREGGWTYEIAQKAAAKLTAAIEAAKKVEPAIDSAWNRFNQALSYGSDAHYPGMAQAFEKHFGQSWCDRDWRGETTTWAAAWKTAVDSSHMSQSLNIDEVVNRFSAYFLHYDQEHLGINEARALLKDCLQGITQAVASEWQPIETAPRDRTVILLRGSKTRHADGFWEPCAYAGNGGWVWPYVHCEPTHWMPLPA
jgi:hypothetical protein